MMIYKDNMKAQVINNFKGSTKAMEQVIYVSANTLETYTVPQGRSKPHKVHNNYHWEGEKLPITNQHARGIIHM